MTTAQSIDRVAEALQVPPEELGQLLLHGQQLMQLCHLLAVQGGWWHDPATGERRVRNKGEMLCLMHSEISEAMEGERKSLRDDHLVHRPMAEVELADLLIRTGDYAGGFGYDVIGALIEKLAYNLTRADHQPENRAQAGGKAF